MSRRRREHCCSPRRTVAPRGRFLVFGFITAHELGSEFVQFMAENKVWWMAPILIVFGVLGVLLVLGSTGVAPFIYALM